MKILTIVCASSSNPITEVTALLGRENIDIRDIDFKQLGDDAFLSLSVTDYDRSLALLLDAGYRAISNDIVLLRGEDKPGGLAEIARRMTEQGVEIRSLTLVDNSSADAVIAVSTSDNQKVRQLFGDEVVN